jgi:hypothetical protein
MIRNTLTLSTFCFLLTVATGTFCLAEDHSLCAGHQSADASMVQRGDEVMGFDHTKTTHHFHLLPTGGTIEASANDPNDAASRDAIQQHFAHISMMFSDGNFEAPMLIHSQNPPGTEIMKKLKAEIQYKFEKTNTGGMIQITSENPEAQAAIHDFLKFQIQEHKTGDPIQP